MANDSISTITYQMFANAGACKIQLELFKSAFGDTFEVTEESVLKAMESGVNSEWLAVQMIADPSLDDFRRKRRSAAEEYNAIRETAWDIYLDVIRAQQAACKESETKFDAIQGPAYQTYVRILQSARDNYLRTVARALVSAYSHAPLDIPRTQI